MAKLGIHKRGSGIEKLYGSSVSHHKPKDLNKGDQIGQHPMTSPIHPNLASLAGGPTGPASTEAAQSSAPVPAAAGRAAITAGSSSAGSKLLKSTAPAIAGSSSSWLGIPPANAIPPVAAAPPS